MTKGRLCFICLLLHSIVYTRTLPFNLNAIYTNENSLVNSVEDSKREMLASNSVELNSGQTSGNPSTNEINDIEVPSYMMELYKKSELDTTESFPHSGGGNTVRAYFNKDTSQTPGLFFFDVSDIDQKREKLLKAEFRVYKRPLPPLRKLKRTFVSSSYLQVNIVDAFTGQVVSSNIINGKSSDWKVFTITNLIQRCISNKTTNKGFYITTQHIYGDKSKFEYFTKKDKSKEPLLLAYTKDENEVSLQSLTDNNKVKKSSRDGQDKKDNSTVVHDNIFNIFHKTRNRRNIIQARIPCQVKELSVSTEKIGWSNKIIQPSAFQINQCVGTCWHDPSRANTKQTNHALLQALYTAVTDGEYSDYPCCAPSKFKSRNALMKDGDTLKLVKLSALEVTSCSCL